MLKRAVCLPFPGLIMESRVHSQRSRAARVLGLLGGVQHSRCGQCLENISSKIRKRVF